MMDLRELELIDIDDDDLNDGIGEKERLVRKARKRKERRPEKERKQKREIEAWPMEVWASQGTSARKNERDAEMHFGSGRNAARQWYKEEQTAEEWEIEEWEEEWEEEEQDWEEEPEEEEWEIPKRPARKDKNKREEKRQREKYLSEEETRVREKKQRRKKRKRRARTIRGVLTFFSAMVIIGAMLGVCCLAIYVYKGMKKEEAVQIISEVDVEEAPNQDIREWAKFYATELERPALAVDLLTVNEYSRPGEALPEVKSIFIHYTANAGTTAEQNRSYFESLAESHERSASAHFVIGYDGTIVQCIPTKEIAYAVKGRNYDSISIECCYLKENGKFEEETYRKLIELTAWLLHKYELRPENVLRHYDEGGKNCPKYYVEHEGAWEDFLSDLRAYMTSVTAE